MSKDFEIKLPKLGESIVSATIVKLHKKENDFIRKDEAIMEVATDKVNSEIPSPVEGTIVKILVKPEQTVQVGEVIAIVSTESQPNKEVEDVKPKSEEKKEKDDSNKSFFSPSVLRLAKEYNLSLEELEKIEGSGESGRISKKDIENYIKSPREKKNYLELSPTRKVIAKNMTKSLRVPHAYLIDDIDVTDIITFIAEKKKDFLDKCSSKLTITTFLAKALANAVKKYPLTNSSFDQDKILLNNDVNLGIAVNVGEDVVVPVIHNIEKLNIVDISKHLNELATRARSNNLSSKDIEKGTITLTNFGMTNIKTGLPIIKYPEASIIGAGAIKKMAWVVNDEIQIRSILSLVMGFDHRVFDGIYACKFVNEIKKYLESEYDRSF